MGRSYQERIVSHLLDSGSRIQRCSSQHLVTQSQRDL